MSEKRMEPTVAPCDGVSAGQTRGWSSYGSAVRTRAQSTSSPSGTPSGPARYWAGLRAWDGSQQRAFEELCFQLRNPAPADWQTIKTAAPDGGLEWYDVAPDGRVFGWQAKFVDSVERLVPLVTESLRSVGLDRPRRNVVKFTVLAPFDLPDPTAVTPKGKSRLGARERWNNAVERWNRTMPGVDGIEIVFRGSGELFERLTQPGNEGRQWFFFQDRALSPDWCRQQWSVAEKIARDRYTADHHVPLAVGSVVDGAALSERVRRRLQASGNGLSAAVRDVDGAWSTWRTSHALELSVYGVSSADAEIGKAVALTRVVHAALQQINVESGFAAGSTASCIDQLINALSNFQKHAAAAKRLLSETDLSSDQPERPQTAAEALEDEAHTSRVVDRTLYLAGRLAETLRGDTAQAAEAGAWLLLGPPGQGKTHLLLDAAKRALDENRLAVTILGEQLSGSDPLTEISRRLGLGDLSHQSLLQAMDAAGAATNARFLIIVDALNDAEQPARWKTELPELLAQVSQYTHVALVVSCRDTMRDLVLPADLGDLQIPTTVHPGFSGHEIEALEQYLRDVPHELPRAPLLLPAFTNGLFVKLYADGLRQKAQRSGTPVTIDGTQHPSAVFESFVDHRAGAICARLGLDPVTRPVHGALQAVAERMAATERDVLEHDDARSCVDSFAPGQTHYPDTMLGQLIAHGLLTSDRFHLPDQEPVAGIAFPYQMMGDYRIVRAVLTHHTDDRAVLAATHQLPASSPLRRWLAAASPNLQEAASVLLPELTGCELIDVLGLATPLSEPAAVYSTHHDAARHNLFRVFLATLSSRPASAVTPRTFELLNQATGELGLDHLALDAILAVAAEPAHPLNAHHLHALLTRMSRVQRDAWWGINIYSTLSHTGPLHRLLRWAEQLPTPDRLQPDRRATPTATILRPHRAGTRPPSPSPLPEPSAAVVELTATALIWTLTSSHRFLRDRATKALVQLLLGHPDVLSALLTRFLRDDADRVEDPYLFERLTLVAYGVVARGGWAQPDAVARIARQILTDVYGDPDSPAHASTHALLCDAAQGIVDVAVRMGVISPDEARPAQHPHPAPKPGEAPTEEQIEELHPRRDQDDRRSWVSLWASLFGLGDFGNYEVKRAVHSFTQLPLDHPRPPHRHAWRDNPDRVSPSHLAAFRASLPEPVQGVLGAPAAVARLLSQDRLAREALTDEQYQLLQTCDRPPPDDLRLFDNDQDEKWAARWIFTRIAELGWTPELFGDFDSVHGHGHGRESHKAERIGKKYQWIALHQLVEQLANHYYPNGNHLGGSPVYIGAWQTLLRDIDPTLPPARHPLIVDDGRIDDDDPRYTTFPPDSPTAFWTPPVPTLPETNSFEAWITTTPSPTFDEVGAIRIDDAGTRWVVLGEYATDTADGRGWRGTHGQPEQWHHIHSWLVPQHQLPDVLNFLSQRSLIPRWMPDERQPHLIYLSEFPDAPAAVSPNETNPEDHDLTYIDHDAADKQSLAQRAEWASSREHPDQADSLLQRFLGPPATLDKLAARWANPDTDDVNNDLPDEVDDVSDHVHRGVDRSGNRLYAFPATQAYSWTAVEADCSIDTPVGTQLPTNTLLAGTELIRHPDRPDWYDHDGTLIVTYRSTTRPTGNVHTLLIREDWLDQRLNHLGYAILTGLLGERQQVTSEPTTWATFSHHASRTPHHDWTFGAPIQTFGAPIQQHQSRPPS
jgi:hypothetical protein